jgi:hypothetical protein
LWKLKLNIFTSPTKSNQILLNSPWCVTIKIFSSRVREVQKSVKSNFHHNFSFDFLLVTKSWAAFKNKLSQIFLIKHFFLSFFSFLLCRDEHKSGKSESTDEEFIKVNSINQNAPRNLMSFTTRNYCVALNSFDLTWSKPTTWWDEKSTTGVHF